MHMTIESTHAKVMDKFNAAKLGLTTLSTLSTSKPSSKNFSGKKIAYVNLYLDELETVFDDYSLDIAPVMAKMGQQSQTNESAATREYYRILAAGNYVSVADRFLSRVILACAGIKGNPEIEIALAAARNAAAISISYVIEKKAYDICKCTARMEVKPEHSVLECPECGRIKELAGIVFRDEQFHPLDGQKTKHGGYDTLRHYKFHIERLQALENKTFDDDILTKIERVIREDNIDKRTLDCEKMRQILRDTRVMSIGKNGSAIKGTKLNDHAPLLVKMCGGASPPLLTFKENQLASLRFSKIMVLYDQVVPAGGNKPYYPYFILKILEHMFTGDTQKLRIIDYIHLQSRETVIKHDKIYEQICALADVDDGLVYTPTNRHRYTCHST